MDDQVSSGTSSRRGLAAALIGLACSMVIWVVTPYNNYIVQGSYIADSYLPVAALALALLLVLAVNPLLRAVRPRLALTQRQLAIILGMMLVACVIPGHGLLRSLPYAIANVPRTARDNPKLAEALATMDLPRGLFPDRITRADKNTPADTPVADQFYDELLPGERIPWRAWVWHGDEPRWRHRPGPLILWGGFLLAGWLMVAGMSQIVLPQWRDNERLAFPLVAVQQSLLEPPDSGRLFGPLFRQRTFWIAAGAVLLLHVLAGGKEYFPDSVPAIPLKWDLSALFTEGHWASLPLHVRSSRIYFILVGAAFFMPNRISFSIWFTIIAYGFYRLISVTYFPPFQDGTMADHRTGAMVAITAAILYIGRAHWVRVFGALFRRARDGLDRSRRSSAAMFLVGLAGLFAWLCWVGVQPGWAAMLAAFAFMTALLIARIVAETGLPSIRIYGDPLTFMKLAPGQWLGMSSMYLAVVIDMVFATSSRVSAATMTTHALALDEGVANPDVSPGAPPPRRRPSSLLAAGLVGLLALGLLVSGAVHLYGGYHHTSTLDNRTQPISPWGWTRLNAGNAAVVEKARGAISTPNYPWGRHIAFGAGLSGLLYWACLAMPNWPFHPVGLLLVETEYGKWGWASVFLGWLAKVLLVQYGGSRLHRVARPFFLGLIMGEVFATVFWAIVPAVLVALGQTYKLVEILPT